jgi:hypothetical protein
MVEQLTLNQLVRGSSPRGATILRQFTARMDQTGCCFFPVRHGKRRSLSRRSSMVEHLFCKQAVAGSNPIAGSSRTRFNFAHAK